jgi:putative SOS response-associated peptidase YedK
VDGDGSQKGDHGHHRSPFFLKLDGLDEWMDRSPRSSDQLLDVLRQYADVPDLETSATREMVASWTKRKSAMENERDEQLAEIEATGPLGFPE